MRPLLATIRRTGAVKALTHITGGGFPDNIPRVLPEGLGARLDLDAIAPPPVFGWLAATGGVAPEEMMRTFNCGVGMMAIVAADRADEVAAVLREEGEPATVIGEVVPAEGDERVRYSGALRLRD